MKTPLQEVAEIAAAQFGNFDRSEVHLDSRAKALRRVLWASFQFATISVCTDGSAALYPLG